MDNIYEVMVVLGVLFLVPINIFLISLADYFCAKCKYINCQGEEKYPHRYKWFFDFFRKDKK